MNQHKPGSLFEAYHQMRMLESLDPFDLLQLPSQVIPEIMGGWSNVIDAFDYVDDTVLGGRWTDTFGDVLPDALGYWMDAWNGDVDPIQDYEDAVGVNPLNPFGILDWGLDPLWMLR